LEDLMTSTVERLGRARLVTVIGLVAGAAGIALQRLAGVEMPVVPPGLVLLVIVAALVAMIRRRWTPALGVLIGLVEVVALVAGAADELANVGATGVLLASWVRALGVATAVVAGTAAVRTERRRAPSAPSPV
jgi:hypothetical protein